MAIYFLQAGSYFPTREIPKGENKEYTQGHSFGWSSKKMWPIVTELLFFNQQISPEKTD